jgi:phosphotransferase system HPr (HPr) family protein
MKKAMILVQAEVGLHARPAAVFVKQAGQFACEIRIRNCTSGSSWVDAKSILGVLTLGVEKNHEIEMEAEGSDEQAAIDALTALVRSNFTVKPLDFLP